MIRLLAGTETVVSSALALLEVERGILSANVRGRIAAQEVGPVGALVAAASSAWTVVPLGREILAAARRRFPLEPVRTLDALHLATLLLVREEIPDLGVLSLDDRIRANARALGVPTVP